MQLASNAVQGSTAMIRRFGGKLRGRGGKRGQRDGTEPYPAVVSPASSPPVHYSRIVLHQPSHRTLGRRGCLTRWCGRRANLTVSFLTRRKPSTYSTSNRSPRGMCRRLISATWPPV